MDSGESLPSLDGPVVELGSLADSVCGNEASSAGVREPSGPARPVQGQLLRAAVLRPHY